MNEEIQLELTEKQIEFLEDNYIELSSLKCLEGKKLHEYMIRNNGYTDNEYLLFFEDYRGGNDQKQKQFLYYMGAENEAELIARHLGISIYGNIDDERLSRYFIQEELDSQVNISS